MNTKLVHVACGAAALLFTTAAGCGAGDDVFSEGVQLDGTGAGDTTSAVGGSTGTDMTTSTQMTTSTTMSTVSVGGAPSTSSVGGQGTGGSGGDDPAKDIECGAELCPVGQGSACCWDNYGQHGPPQAECVAGSFESDGCATGVEGDIDFGLETRIECQVPDHCPGQICCATRRFAAQLGNLYIDLQCRNECDYDEREVTLCDNPGETAGCPMITPDNGGQVQSVCKQSGLLPIGYFICGTP